jgi:uncharacterized membrane protein YjjP (DUF1212 family)
MNHNINDDKRPLAYYELRDVIDLSLWAGQMLLQHGAASQRVEETIHLLGTGLGCDWMDILVSPNVIIVTTSSGQEFRTKTRRVVRMGVNMWAVTAVNDLSRRVTNGQLNRFQLRTELENIDRTPPQYNRWFTILMVGLACAAFSRLFGGDWPVFGITFAAAAVGMFIRQLLTKLYFNPNLIVTAVAFIATLIAGTATLFKLSPEPEIVLVASVLLLVPGVPLINAAKDLLRGHLIVGIARGVTGLIISLAIALGLLLAMRLLGVSGL